MAEELAPEGKPQQPTFVETLGETIMASAGTTRTTGMTDSSEDVDFDFAS